MTERRRRLAIRLCELVAVVATALALVLLTQGGGSGGHPARERPRPAALDPRSDADHDGVPNGRDLQPLVAAAPTPAQRQPGPTPPPAPRPNCKRLGITRQGGKEGRCIDVDGRRIDVVDRASLLSLKEMNVSLAPIELRRHVGRGSDRVDAAGVFAIVTATIRNRLRQAARFRPEQMLLLLGRGSYQHDSAAEGVSRRSFLLSGGKIPSHRERTGTVIFDVPRRAARHLTRDGNLVIVQFTDPSYQDAYRTVGYIRTYR